MENQENRNETEYNIEDQLESLYLLSPIKIKKYE